MPRINFHTHHSQNAFRVRSYDLHESILLEKYFTVGLHPWHIEPDNVDQDLIGLQALLTDPNCIAVGECGLDRLQGPALGIQRSVFIRQCELASANKKPVVVHVVRCYPELVEIIRKFPELVFALHGFTGNQHWANTFHALGCYFSFGNTLKPGNPLSNVFKSIPLERIFLETDDQMESTLEEVYRNAAAIAGLEESELETIVEANFKRFQENAQP
jgi:TatD DNase family protein